jgi:cell division protein ZapA
MNTMNDTEVVLNHKSYTLCGYESSDYLQKIASYINGKQAEFKSKGTLNKLDQEMKNILLEINIADDYFKAQKRASELADDNENKNNEIFDLKHELIKVQTMLESIQKELQVIKSDNLEAQKKIVRLETELEERKSNK